MKKAINTLLQLGVRHDQSIHEQKKTQTTNLLNALMAFFVLLGSLLNYPVISKQFIFLPVCVFFLLSVFGLFLSWKHLNQCAHILFTLNVNLAVFYINQFHPPEADPYLYYFPLVVGTVLLNNPSFKNVNAIPHVALCVIFFIVNFNVDLPWIGLENMPAEKIREMWYVNFSMSLLSTTALLLLLTRLIASQNKEIILQNSDLTRAKETVKASLREKEILLAELHHRVKNNLAIISGLLNLQEDATQNEEAKRIISDTKTRIMSMALVHRMLYENPELKSIQVGKYASELIAELFNSYNLSKSVELKQLYDNIALPVNKSIPLGLILNEIVTNSIKYVYKARPRQKGVFEISIRQLENKSVLLTIEDHGPGFPQDFNASPEPVSLGIYLIKSLAGQIDGEVLFSNANGARIELNFLPD